MLHPHLLECPKGDKACRDLQVLDHKLPLAREASAAKAQGGAGSMRVADTIAHSNFLTGESLVRQPKAVGALRALLPVKGPQETKRVKVCRNAARGMPLAGYASKAQTLTKGAVWSLCAVGTTVYSKASSYKGGAFWATQDGRGVAGTLTGESPKRDEACRGVQECRAQGVTVRGCQRSKGAGKGRVRVHLGRGHHRAQHQRQKHVEHTCNSCRPNNADGNVNRGILHLHRVISCTSDMPCWIMLSLQGRRACKLQMQ